MVETGAFPLLGWGEKMFPELSLIVTVIESVRRLKFGLVEVSTDFRASGLILAISPM